MWNGSLNQTQNSKKNFATYQTNANRFYQARGFYSKYNFKNVFLVYIFVENFNIDHFIREIAKRQFQKTAIRR